MDDIDGGSTLAWYDFIPPKCTQRKQKIVQAKESGEEEGGRKYYEKAIDSARTKMPNVRTPQSRPALIRAGDKAENPESNKTKIKYNSQATKNVNQERHDEGDSRCKVHCQVA